jgi:ATP-dependent Clp protease ATP-binding subunit ClpA
MGRVRALINRVLPFLFFVTLIVALARTVRHYDADLGHWASDLIGFARAWRGEILALAVLFWLMVTLGLLAGAGRLPPWLLRRRWLMDVLDRLTNRAALEGRMSKDADAEFIDAAVLADALKSRVIGQNAICDDLAAQIRRRLALQQRGKPVGVFLFAGYPGTGKTYLGKRLAAELHRNLLHLDMTQLSRGMGATILFGSPKGYVGSDSYGKLTAGLRETPDAVVLLDEVEKADPEVHKKFLTAWNDGFVTEASDGRQISTTRAVFILTTNAALDTLEDIRRRCAHDPDEMRRTATTALKDAGFAPEVLNRIDRIFVFSRLEGLDVARVTALEIEQMIQGYGLAVGKQGIDPELLYRMMRRQERLADAGSSRDLVRAIEESIADSLISAKQQGARCVALIEGANGVLAKPVECPQAEASS